MNINENLQSSESQNAKIRAWLEEGNTLTQLQALKLFGCFRLASRIHDLRDRGLNIIKQMVTGDNGKLYAQYQLGL